MIVYEEHGDGMIRAYSDAGMKIHGGSPEGDYVEAIDPVSAGRTYTETEIPVEPEQDPTVEEKAEAFDIMIGGAE